MSKIEVRGHRSLLTPPHWTDIALAMLVDFFVPWIVLFSLSLTSPRMPPWTLQNLLFVQLGLLGFYLFCQWVFGATPGQSLWRIRWMLRTTAGKRLLRTSAFSNVTRTIATLFTLGSTGVFWILLYHCVLAHPLYGTLETRTIKPFVSLSFQDAPVFYALGAFPTHLDETPLFYSTRYEKGVPHRFIGRVFTRLRGGSTLTFEGPKTPTETLSGNALKECFLNRLTCLQTREQTLLRHIEEMAQAGYFFKHAQWIEVQNDAIPSEEQVRGLWLVGVKGDIHQARMIAVTASGAQQTFILHFNQPAALLLFEQILGTLRFPQDITANRAWIDHVLSEINVQKAPQQEDTIASLKRLSRYAFLLLSKASVDPKNVLTFYHLGGMAHLIVKQASLALRDSKKVLSADHHRLLEEAVSMMKPLMQASYEFAKDINPQDPNTRRLEQLWIETVKFTNP